MPDYPTTIYILAAIGTAIGIWQADGPTRPIGPSQWTAYIVLVLIVSALWPATLACEIMAPDRQD